MPSTLIRLAALAAIAFPSAAAAQAAPTDVAAPVAAPVETPAVFEAPAPFAGSALADDALQAIAGREDTTQVAQSQQAATVTRNSVGDNVRTGDARIEGQAFQNLSGLAILNVNTGNNVAINAAMNVTVAIGQ